MEAYLKMLALTALKLRSSACQSVDQLLKPSAFKCFFVVSLKCDALIL